MIKIVAVGKLKEKYLHDAIKEYSKRISAYSKLEIIEVMDESIGAKASDSEIEKIKKEEGSKILSKISDDDFVIVLDLNGKSLSSIELSEVVDEVFTYRTDKISFVIGGSLGFSQEVINRSNLRWKLSDCTFPHQIVRVLLVEQIYRVFKIMKNENYHK
ncbi:MAG: 23S rRNA (pseudouridine(1915)-N(3))-methyltransferase RlmH [Anaerorhabdus sp.]